MAARHARFGGGESDSSEPSCEFMGNFSDPISNFWPISSVLCPLDVVGPAAKRRRALMCVFTKHTEELSYESSFSSKGRGRGLEREHKPGSIT